MFFRHFFSLFPLAAGALAHGPATPAEIAARDIFLSERAEPMSICRQKMKARGLFDDAAARRAGLAMALRKKRGIPEDGTHPLKRRDLAEDLKKSHMSNLTGLAWDADPNKLFHTDKYCLLTPETTEGPYWVEGEYIRPNIVEDQAGVPLYLDVQMFDVNTCEPLKDAFFEIWHANATGVYSGVRARSNGNFADENNVKTTFGRGIQQSDDQGVVQFETIFPGHYVGRAIHIHILAHVGATALPNGTVSGGHVSHVGQIFWDQDLIDSVEKTHPYTSNQQELTLNKDDGDNIIEDQARENYDPFAEYVLLGNHVSQGILTWITIGIDPKSEKQVMNAGKVQGQATTTTGFEGIHAPPTLSVQGQSGSVNMATPSSGAARTGGIAALWAAAVGTAMRLLL